MTVSYITDHETMELAIIEWLQVQSGLPDNRVRFMNSATVRPPLPCGAIQIITDGMVEGQDAEFMEYNADSDLIDTVLYGPRRMTLQVALYTEPGTEDIAGRSARIRLNGALAALRSRTVKDLFFDAGLSFLQMLSAPRAIDEQIGDRWERRMQADIELGYTGLVTDTVNWIETADDPIITYL